MIEAEPYIDVVDRRPNLGAIFFSERNHITYVVLEYVVKDLHMAALTLLAWYGDGEELVANSGTNSSEKLGISFDLVYLVRIGYLFIVGSIPSRVFPIDI